ncbi:MAG: lipopolysaccharide heptosyltransferase II [Bdellovibrionales bacterium]|nr:lipopolysaccharide heptosyltransferase II [Bdellovibrionales bacterium]
MKILLVQTAFLGDIILSTPVIAGLHQCFPGCELWMLTTPMAKPLVERDPLLKGVLAFEKRGKHRTLSGMRMFARELREMNFDMVYSLHRSFRTSLLLWMSGIPVRVGFSHAVGSFLYTKTVDRLVGAHDVLRNLSLLQGEQPEVVLDNSLRLFPPPEETLQEHLQRIQHESFVVLVPGSAWATKRWTVAGYREVAAHFLGLGKSVVILGAPNEVEIAKQVSQGLEVLNLCGQTSIAQMVGIIGKSSLIVCNDSMALHVASSLKIPTVTVFCATSPHFGFGPWKNRATVVEKLDLSCKPCRRHGSNRCPTGTELCMTGVSSAEVIEAAQEYL